MHLDNTKGGSIIVSIFIFHHLISCGLCFMAGLQYKFFPTDFLFPRQKSLNTDNSHRQVIPINNTRNSGKINDEELPKSLILHHVINDKHLKALPPSSSSLPQTLKSKKN